MSAADRSKWDARYRERGPEVVEPDAFLVSLDAILPRTGRALDVAGGAGRNAIWLASRGLRVTLVDISATGLDRARAAAEVAGVVLDLVCADLDVEPLPSGPFDVVASFNFLRRELFRTFPGVLAPGGVLVYSQPTMANLERHDKPPSGFLLENGELPRLVSGLAVVRCHEGWTRPGPDGRHEAHLLARRT